MIWQVFLARRLKKSKHSGQRLLDDEIYALARLSLNIQEPFRSKARALLKGVCKRRNMIWPKGSMGLQFAICC